MPHSSQEFDSQTDIDVPAREGESRALGHAIATPTSATGRAWVGDLQGPCSVPSTAASTVSDTINSTDADVYSYREEWDLGGPSSEPASSRSSDGASSSDHDGNNLGDNGDYDSCGLEAPSQLKGSVASAVLDRVPQRTPDKLDVAEMPGPEEDALAARSAPCSSPGSPRTDRADVSNSTDCQDIGDTEAVAPQDGTYSAPRTTTDIQDDEPRRIQVLVRVRPSAGSAEDKVVVTVGEQGTSIQVQSPSGHASLAGALGAGSMTTVTECAFDRVFGASASQHDVFCAVEPSVRAAMDGYNATVLAYGQTGTGKTHTLFGKDFGAGDTAGVWTPSCDEEHGSSADPSLSASSMTAPTWGVVPRALWLLLSLSAKLEAEAATGAAERVHVALHCSFVQIYNDRLFDLLTDRRRQKPLLLREQPRADGSTHVVVAGLSSERVLSVAHALQLVRRGLENRSVRETEANLASSRSHAVVQVNVALERVSAAGERSTRTSRLNLVDLAGSEKWNTDVAMDDAHSLELKNINASLSALGNCIAALAEPGRRHIPFRDSTLTRVLQDSLGGNTQAYLVATVSPSLAACDETLRTLQFADRARSVMQSVRVNETSGSAAAMVATELLAARAQVAKLRDKLESAQRRHHEARVKELEAAQRKFSDALKDKDRELGKLARENAGLLKWRDEDARRIRALEAQVRALEAARDSSDQQAARTVGGCALDEAASSDKTVISTAQGVDDEGGGSGGAARPNVRNELARPTPKASLPRLASDRSKEALPTAQAARTYKQLLERYALQPGKSRHERLPSAARQPGLSPVCGQEPSDCDRSFQPHAPTLSALKDAGYSASTPLLPMATRIPRVTSVSPRGLSPAACTQPSPLDVAAWRRSSSSLTPRRVELEESPAARPPPTKLASDAVEAWTRRSATCSSDAIAAALPTAPKPAASASVCAKHSLRGCVLCGGAMDLSQARQPAASYPGPTPAVRAPSEALASPDEPCARHRLARCFICSKATGGEGRRGCGGGSTAEAGSVAAATGPAGVSAQAAKCSAHSLSNCILCGSKGAQGQGHTSGSAPAAQPRSTSYGEDPPRRFTLDARLLGLPGASQSMLSSTSSPYAHPPASISERGGHQLAMYPYPMPQQLPIGALHPSLHADGAVPYAIPSDPSRWPNMSS